MTKNPPLADLAERGRYDPAPGTFHIHDFVARLKDGVYARDFLSDFVIGVVFCAVKFKLIKMWEACLVQVPFRKSLEIRGGKGSPKGFAIRFGHPFLDPFGAIITLTDAKGTTRRLLGNRPGCDALADSEFPASDLPDADGYDAWVKTNFYANRGTELSYVRTGQANSRIDCDTHTNELLYAPGPGSVVPTTRVWDDALEDTVIRAGTPKKALHAKGKSTAVKDAGDGSESEPVAGPSRSSRRKTPTKAVKPAAPLSAARVDAEDDADDDALGNADEMAVDNADDTADASVSPFYFPRRAWEISSLSSVQADQ